MSNSPPNVGKMVIEDDGIALGRTRDWPAIPKGLCRRLPSTGSTTVVCYLCGSPWDGLIYDAPTGAFRHRGECPKILI